MNKIWLIIGASLGLVAYTSANFFDDQATIDAFKKKVTKALINEDNDDDLKALQDFMVANEGLNEENQNILQRRGIYGKLTLLEVLDSFDSRLFSNREAVTQCVFPTLSAYLSDGKELVDVVVDLIQDADEYGLALVGHGYGKQKVNVDQFFFKRIPAELHTTIGEYIDMRVADNDQFWISIANLVGPERDKNAPVKFDQGLFVRLVIECLMERSNIKHLKDFVKKVQTVPDINAIFYEPSQCSLGDFLDHLNPELYQRRDAILNLIKPDGDKPKNPEGLSDVDKKAYAENDVANMIRQYVVQFKKGTKWPDADDIRMVYIKFPICVDEFAGLNEGKTLGDEIDSALASDFGNAVFELVSKKRKKIALSSEQQQEFITLVLQCLAAGEGDPVLEKLKSFCAKNKISKQVVDSIEIELNLSGTMATFIGTMSQERFKPFIEGLSPRLFPNKKFVIAEGFKASSIKATAHDHENEKFSLGFLIKISMNMPEFVPLVRNGLAHYRSAYPADDIDLDELKYKGTTVQKYLSEHQNMLQYTEYKQLFPKNFSQNSGQGPAPKGEMITPQETEKSMALWKKIAIFGVAGIVTFVLYKYSQKTEKESRTEIA